MTAASRADADVVRDVHEVVDPGPRPDPGVVERAAVDAGVGADLAPRPRPPPRRCAGTARAPPSRRARSRSRPSRAPCRRGRRRRAEAHTAQHAHPRMQDGAGRRPPRRPRPCSPPRRTRRRRAARAGSTHAVAWTPAAGGSGAKSADRTRMKASRALGERDDHGPGAGQPVGDLAVDDDDRRVAGGDGRAVALGRAGGAEGDGAGSGRAERGGARHGRARRLGARRVRRAADQGRGRRATVVIGPGGRRRAAARGATAQTSASPRARSGRAGRRRPPAASRARKSSRGWSASPSHSSGWVFRRRRPGGASPKSSSSVSSRHARQESLTYTTSANACGCTKRPPAANTSRPPRPGLCMQIDATGASTSPPGSPPPAPGAPRPRARRPDRRPGRSAGRSGGRAPPGRAARRGWAGRRG